MRVMTQILQPYIGRFVIVYFDSVLIYSSSEDEQTHHLHQVLHVLQVEKLYINLKKCLFAQPKFTFLGFVVSTQGVEADPKKIKSILEQLVPTNIHEVRSFQGLSPFYQRFIKSFGAILPQITECTKSGPFMWGTQAANHAFEEIKHKMNHASILCLPNFDKVFEVSCDVLHLGIEGLMCQEGHHMDFFFCEKLSNA
jgi:hypothetical protein